MAVISGKRILFFAPKFFGYEKKIAKKLEEMGAIVDPFDERPGNSFVAKSILRLYSKGINNTTRLYYSRILSKIKNNTYDYVFIVNLEAMTEEIITNLRTAFKDAIFILYMWDSSLNKKSLTKVYSLFDYRYTFDRFDANNIPGFKFRPLFYTDIYLNLPLVSKKYDLSFVGTAHGDRSFIVKKVQAQLQAAAMNFFFYLYLNSKLLYYYLHFSNPKFRATSSYKEYSFKPLKELDIVNIIAASQAVLDIQHGLQTGLTMRTFEVLGAEKKLITTNADIVNYDFYHRDNILVINRDKPVIDKAFLESSYKILPDEIKFKYSIGGWLSEIFSFV